MFKKGDYITIMKDTASTSNWENFVVKQIGTNVNIIPIITPFGRNNSNMVESYSHFSEKDNIWRYSTKEEIEEYDRLGKPFDISKFKPFTLPDKWHIIVTKENAEDVLKWRFGESYEDEDKLKYQDFIVGITLNHGGIFEKGHNPKNKIKGDSYDFGIEITYEQFKKHYLNKENYEYLIKLLGKLNIK